MDYRSIVDPVEMHVAAVVAERNFETVSCHAKPAKYDSPFFRFRVSAKMSRISHAFYATRRKCGR